MNPSDYWREYTRTKAKQHSVSTINYASQGIYQYNDQAKLEHDNREMKVKLKKIKSRIGQTVNTEKKINKQKHVMQVSRDICKFNKLTYNSHHQNKRANLTNDNF